MKAGLAAIATTRCGDKGDDANIAVFAKRPELYAALVREVTPARVKALFGTLVRGDVERFEVPGITALNFLLHEALDGGAARSLRSDQLGKSLGALMLRLEVELTDAEAEHVAS